jgi:cholesterol oxidase
MYDVAVVGSGFGGSVAALRAAQAGKQVVVLEQGRRLRPEDLQAGAASPFKLLWEPALGLRGYFQQKMLRHVMVVGGVGVGGGSIVYAAVLLKPDRFNGAWASLGVDWAADLAPHYDEAARMLGREPNPQWDIQDDWLRAASEAMGVGSTFGKTPQGIRFADCLACGQCITGCPHGAKVFGYLPQAEALGVEVRPLTRAEILVPRPNGWRVVTRDPVSGTVSSVEAREVVLAAGVLGTVQLLLACREKWGTLPGLTDAVGKHVRTNSEAFAAILHPPGTDVTHGATISSDFYPDQTTHVTNNRFPASYGFMRYYLSPVVDGDRRRATVRALVRDPRGFTANVWARDWHKRVTILTVMQNADNEMALQWRRGRMRSVLPEGVEPVPVSLPQADAAGRAVAAVSGGRAYTTLMESVLGVGATAHILGGAVLGEVVDAEHRVLGYEGLRIMDGSVVPENIGVNPSWTITALAERACAHWL